MARNSMRSVPNLDVGRAGIERKASSRFGGPRPRDRGPSKIVAAGLLRKQTDSRRPSIADPQSDLGELVKNRRR